MVLSGELVHLLLVGNISVLKLMKPVLLLARVVLLEALDLAAEALIVSNQVLLVRAMLAGVLLDADARLSNVHLEFASLGLGVTDELLVNYYVSLQVVANLQDMSDCLELTATCSESATIVVLR